jgi:hypothetical protein
VEARDLGLDLGQRQADANGGDRQALVAHRLADRDAGADAHARQ